jgi:hypothetical protein
MLCVFMCFIVELCCFGLFSCMYGVSVWFATLIFVDFNCSVSA